MLLNINEQFSRVSGSQVLAKIARQILCDEHRFDQEKEHFIAVGLNAKNEIKFVDLVTLGTLDASLVHPRETFRRAVEQAAHSIAIIHNHPSGDPAPSQEDRNVTERLIKAGKVLGIEVLDHVIVGNDTGKYCSLREDFEHPWH